MFLVSLKLFNPGLRIRIHFIWFRIQHFRLNTNPDPDPIRIQGFTDQKLEKNYSWKKKFWSKTAIYLSLGLHKVGPSYRRSLQLSKEAIQHFKTWTFKKLFYFCGSYLPSWIQIPNPDPLTRLNPDPIRIRNAYADLIHVTMLQAVSGVHVRSTVREGVHVSERRAL